MIFFGLSKAGTGFVENLQGWGKLAHMRDPHTADVTGMR
jgi:hypothetical protein